MFRAIDNQTQESVIIIDSEKWNGQTIGCLRDRANNGSLICPTCASPVRVKAGEIVTWHFAHQAVSDCPFQDESARQLLMRQACFRWLNARFPGAVEVETRIDGLHSSRPFDIAVRLQSGVAFYYWLIDKNIRDQEIRWGMERVLSSESLHAHVVFDRRMLKLEEGSVKTVRLRPTEREFTQRSRFDSLYSRARSLFYLEPESQWMTIMRGVGRGGICTPEHDTIKNRSLDQVMVCDQTGTFYINEEGEALARQEEEKQRRLEIAREQEEATRRFDESMRPAQRASMNRSELSRSEVYVPPRSRTVPCELCGRNTPEEDQIIYKAGKCKCRDCMGMRRTGG
jgi:hypothetical protein